jgi:glutamyl-tRNA(Gln) amidotransferase subunit E
MDYDKLGLKVGLEIHQELATEHKLFCKCPPSLFSEEPEYTFIRRLRPSQSELGEVDPAALFEFTKGKTIIYEANTETSCLVEIDEEPPGPLNAEAIDICLTLAIMTGSSSVDEIHVMRKIVVDGSNTTGFQRTCVTSLWGTLEVEDRTHHLQQISLEEDAARKISEEDGVSRYRIDRLGIPLIEVATAPDIHSPEEAEKVAIAIGRILRATEKVRRGLGTIRQDINISIVGGALTEVKGVQQLNLISKVIEYEVQRQVHLLELVSELGQRGVKATDIVNAFVDVTDVFTSTNNFIICNSVKKGGKVLGLKLKNFADLVGRELCPNRRLGTEMADHARYHGGVKGIFHTDELPAYNISSEEVEALRVRMEASDLDAVVIVADDEERCKKALEAVADRARHALEGVPIETRSANPDGTTYFTRPRPGAARMYPETDIPSIPITPERLERLKMNLPEMPETKIERFKADYGLNKKLSQQVIDSNYTGLFEEMVRDNLADPILLAVILTEDFRGLERGGVKVENHTDETIRDVFKLLDKGQTAKESLPQLFSWLALNPGSSPGDALVSLSLEMMSKEELERLVDEKVSKRRGFVEQMGKRAFGPLMGVLMGEVRGKAQVQDVQALLKKAIISITEE